MEDEKIFITNIYHSVSIEVLKKNISRLVYPIIYEEISNMAKNLNEDDKVFITNFYKYALIYLLNYNLETLEYILVILAIKKNRRAKKYVCIFGDNNIIFTTHCLTTKVRRFLLCKLCKYFTKFIILKLINP